MNITTVQSSAGSAPSLGELAAGVAHEINNPINGIINYAQILIDKSEETGEDAEIPERIISEGERTAGIVNNLLSFARKQKEDEEPVSWEEVLKVFNQNVNNVIRLIIKAISKID